MDGAGARLRLVQLQFGLDEPSKPLSVGWDGSIAAPCKELEPDRAGWDAAIPRGVASFMPSAGPHTPSLMLASVREEETEGLSRGVMVGAATGAPQ